jgi:hypothetical protein
MRVKNLNVITRGFFLKETPVFSNKDEIIYF